MRICNCSNSNFFVILALSHMAAALFSYYYFFFYNRHDQLVEVSLQTTKLEAVVNNIDDIPERPYKFFYFALTWPGSYTPRSEKVPQNFTIHGLWPNCKKPCPGSPFNESQIATIITELEKEWPSIKQNCSNEEFWKHEWEKHGTCSEDVLDQFNYFNSTLRLKSHIDILQTLENKGVIPSMERNYSLKLIIETLKDIKAARIKCDNTTTKDVLLLEIRFCVDHNGTSFIDCKNRSSMNCTRDTIKFPTIK